MNKILGTIAYWYGGNIITQVLKYENDTEYSCLVRAEQGMRIMNELDNLPYLQFATPRFYKQGD